MWKLSHGWQGEIIRAEITEVVGAEHAAELEIHYPEGGSITLPKGIEFNISEQDGEPRISLGPFLDRGKGSNAWVIAPSRSETGCAVLCNDMHLQLSLPGLWYQVDLNAGDDLHVTGVSLPGLPMVLVGHNAKIAWGMTLAFTDAEDLFIEQIDSHDRYLYKDDWHDVDIIQEVIEVKKRLEPHIEKVMVTRHGPIISDVVGFPDQKVAVNSMALKPCPAFNGWFKLNKANGWDEFVDSMQLIEAPQLNVAYADVDGNIGYWVTGKVPVRRSGDGSVPVPGWSGEYEWVGEIPFEEMPYAFNPDQGYLVTCNQKIMPDNYPYFLGNFWMNGYRAKRLEELIESREIISLKEHVSFQMDFRCIPGSELVQHLDRVTDPDPDVQLALKLLRNWDGFLNPETIGGTVYEVFRYTLVKNLIAPGLGEDLTIRLMGRGFHPLLNSSNEFYGNDTNVMLRMLDNPKSWWMKEAGGREVVLSKSLKQSVDWLRVNLGMDETDWEWGKIHRVYLEHPLSLQKPFDEVFNRGPFPIGGDTDTPCQTGMQPDSPYDNKAWTPSFRIIVDMGDLGNSFTITPPGQSGQLTSEHYDDLMEPWLLGEPHPMLWTRAQVEAEAKSRLLLKGKNNH
jgi:penicillin amidase